MSRSTVFAARIILVALFLGCILFQFALPQLAYDIGGGFMETKHLVIPYAVTEIVAIGFVEAVIVLVWMLVTRLRQERIFSAGSRRLTRGVYFLIIAATVVAVAPPVHLLVFVQVGGPGVILATLAFIVAGLGVALAARMLMASIVRGEAIETELEGVI